jgi:hypothetical protein
MFLFLNVLPLSSRNRCFVQDGWENQILAGPNELNRISLKLSPNYQKWDEKEKIEL